LAQAGQADVAMAPAADMFEMGVKVQVLKRGTMFPLRAAKLYDLYSRHASFESINAKDRASTWNGTISANPLMMNGSIPGRFSNSAIPLRLEKAESDPRHKMAPCFPVLSWASIKLGQPGRTIETDGLPDMVRSVHWRFQRLGKRDISRKPGQPENR
jgi:trans-AT polyketide synthase/acyltransferase/oxidoreductase domain-containing protein